MRRIKLNLILGFFVVLIFCGFFIIALCINPAQIQPSSLINQAFAEEENSFAIENSAKNNTEINSTEINANNGTDNNTTISWPMLAGESLNDVAKLFYPKNKVMQRHFVRKSLQLNADTQTAFHEDQRFSEPTLLTIPTLKSLSHSTHGNQSAKKKSDKRKLQLSYEIKKTVENIPALLLQEYELLVNKNAFLKAELAKLNEKLTFLQKKLNNLKLILDKSLSLPAAANASTNATTSNTNVIDNAATNAVGANPATPNNMAVATDASNAAATKKVFKNLNSAAPKPPLASALVKPKVAPAEAVSILDSLFGMLSSNLLLLGLVVALILGAGIYALKKYRQNVFNKFSASMPKMEDTPLDFGPNWQDTEVEAMPPSAADFVVTEVDENQHQENEAAEFKHTEAFANTQTPANTQTNTEAQANNDEVNLDTTLEEAKLLMSINRNTDAIAHLKMTIDSHPKSSINHWLYLLEVFRKLNLKEEFEKYAQGLHSNFNVTAQHWDDTIVPGVMLQQLEDYPNIMEKLYPLWPNETAKVYLRSLITDNRDGTRAGFGKAVLTEIMLLIMLIETRKDFD